MKVIPLTDAERKQVQKLYAERREIIDQIADRQNAKENVDRRIDYQLQTLRVSHGTDDSAVLDDTNSYLIGARHDNDLPF